MTRPFGDTIQNGCNTPLNERAGMVPQMQGALQNYFQPMTFVQIGKFISGGFMVETGTPVNFRGVMMPAKARTLEQKKEGERKWVWWTLFCTPELQLRPDDVNSYLNDQFRCIDTKNWDIYGFMEYTLVQDYTGTISNLVYDPAGKLVDDGNQVAPPELETE